MSYFVTVAEEAARLGGDVLREWAGKFQVREKGRSDLVTEADEASQQRIAEFLSSTFPEHDFLGEEGPRNVARKSPYCWIVDPLDGTTNYVHGLANYAVSVALEYDGRIVAGAIYDPVADESFTASAGGGAWLNGRRLEVSGITTLDQALVAASFGASVRADSPEIPPFLRVLETAQGVRRMGSAALNLAYIAAGRLDGYWALATKIWDVAAGLLMVAEAGGHFTSWDGEPVRPIPHQFIAAASEPLHRELRDLLKQ